MIRKDLEHTTIDIDAVQPHPKNVRHGDIGAISESLKAHGQYRPIVVDKRTNQILAGNHTWKAAKALGWKEISVGFVTTKNEDEATRILLADNRTTDLATYDDSALADLLKELASTDQGLDGTLFDGDALDQLLLDLDREPFDDDKTSKFSQAVKVPQYEIVGEQPKTTELLDQTRAQQLQKQIEQADLPDDVREFLMFATTRHIVFNYQKIAEFYPHQPAEIQELMEKSVLIIIDADDAIANGYATFDSAIANIRDADNDA